jgi:hypothetical protein
MKLEEIVDLRLLPAFEKEDGSAYYVGGFGIVEENTTFHSRIGRIRSLYHYNAYLYLNEICPIIVKPLLSTIKDAIE